MMPLPQELHIFSLLARILGFVGFFSLFPRRLVPISVNISLVVILFFVFGAGAFAMPEVSQTFSWQLGLREFALGVLLALPLSAGGYVALLAGGWLSRTLFGSVRSTEEFSRDTTPSELLHTYNDILRLFFILLFLYLLFHTVGFAEMVAAIAPAFSGSAAPAQIGTASIDQVIVRTLTVSFGAAALLFLPIFAAALLSDLFFLIINRYFSYVVSGGIVASVRIAVIVCLLSLSIFALSAQFSEVIYSSLQFFNWH